MASVYGEYYVEQPDEDLENWDITQTEYALDPRVCLSHQIEFLADFKTRYLALCGGFGAGKTIANAHKALNLAIRNPGLEGCVLAPTNNMAKRILVPVMCTLFDALNVKYVWKVSDRLFEIQVTSTKKSIIHVLSGENYTRLAGLNLAWAGVDEMDLIKVDTAELLFDMLISRTRVRQSKAIQVYFTSTPEGFKFLYNTFVKEVNNSKSDPNIKPITNRRIIHAKTRDNPFLKKGYLESMIADYSPQQIEAYTEGKFVNFTNNTVYYAFDRMLNHTDETVQANPNHILHIGLDFNVGKMAACTCIVKNGEPHVVDEIMMLKNTEAMITEIQKRYPNREIYVYPDASGKNEKSSASLTDHQLLKKAGFKVIPPGLSNPRVKDRVTVVNGMFCNGLQQRRLKVNTHVCVRLTDCLEQQVYDRYGEPDKKHDTDHGNDSLGYFVYTVFPMKSRANVRVS